MQNTLVQLMEWSHIEHMYGRLSTHKHQELYSSWHKITKSFYATLDRENKIQCVSCDTWILNCFVRCPECGVFSA